MCKDEGDALAHIADPVSALRVTWLVGSADGGCNAARPILTTGIDSTQADGYESRAGPQT
jgi:hypothetical protein